LLDIYLVRPASSFIPCSNVQGISDYRGILLEVEWGENSLEHQVEKLVLVYHKTNVPSLQSFLTGKFASRANNGSYVEETGKRFKENSLREHRSLCLHKILR
jgi:hypothetical protein